MLMVPGSFNAGTADGAVRLAAPAIAWAAARKISAETLGLLGVGSGTVFFPDLTRKADAIFFRYETGWKARAYPEKSFVAGGGFKIAFWNLASVLAGSSNEVWITEGEMDALALVEAGVPPDRVLSVPNGAKEKPADDPKEMRGYAYVEEALRAGLSRIKKFIWCGDGDGNGRALRQDMAKLLGPARFSFVEWPEGCKDANDVLVSDGPDALRELVTDGAHVWPVAGLFKLFDLPEPPAFTLWNPGFPEWESRVMLAPKTLSVVTGHPGMGKTQLFAQIWFQIVRDYGVPACIATFETRAKPHYRRQLRTLHSKKLERDMSEEEINRADYWINDRYLFLIHPEQRPTLDWFLDMAEVAVVRHGARIIQLDPWNRLEASRTGNETETEYIGRCLRALYNFAHDMNCHVQIVAHPAKMDGTRRGKPPELEDIAGSKHWQNMVDQGFVVHRPEIFDGTNRKTEATLFHKKARFDELGYPCSLKLDYKVMSGRYASIDYQM